MLRPSRKQQSTSTTSSGFNQNGSTSPRHSDDTSGKSKPLFPTPVLAAIFASFLLVGIGDHYHRKSRSSKGHTVLSRRIVDNNRDDESLRLKLPSLSDVDKGSVSAGNVGPSGDVHISPTTSTVGFTPQEDAQLLLTPNGKSIHIIFSTDCSDFQHWQSYLMFHSAMRIRQPGRVTRIASGCTKAQTEAVQKFFEEHITIMSKRFHIHFTPKFSNVLNGDGKAIGDYKFFNKPFGLRHFMEQSEHMGFMKDKKTMKEEDTIVILIDPDMVLLRPITNDYSNDRETVIGKRHVENRKYTVEHGQPFAQKYGLGTQWRKFDLKVITGDETTPALSVTQSEGGQYYTAGPPYIATARDMHSLSVKWTEFVPKVHAEYPHLLAEMYAYCIAAAHLGLKHQMIDSLMVSKLDAGGEGWPLLDKIPQDQMCTFAMKPDHTQYAIPNVVHHCQRYGVGDYFYSKRRLPQNFFSCNMPLLEEPPSDITNVRYKVFPSNVRKDDQTADEIWKDAFLVCAMIGALNDAATFFKANANHCVNPRGGNLNKILKLNRGI